MATLPANPSIEQLRHQAEDLLRAAQRGDAEALAQLEVVSDRPSLAGAQLALAREYGQPSWPALTAEVERRTRSWERTVAAFLTASIGGRLGRAARLLSEAPALARDSYATALVLGDADRVAAELAADPAAATRPDPSTRWTPLHAACSSRWHADPVRAEGLLRTVTVLLDAGADPVGTTPERSQRTPLRCAIASATAGTGNEPILRLLLDRGAKVADHDLYLAGFAAAPARCVSLLLEHVPDAAETAEQALAAPISTGDSEVVRLLLEAGVDPGRYRNDNGDPAAPIPAALAADASLEIVELLLAHGADADAPGPDGRPPLRLATALGRRDVAALLTRYGAADTTTALDRLVDAVWHADHDSARRRVAADPGLLDDLAPADAAVLVRATDAGNADAVRLMVDLGFPLDARSETDDGATALHAAAYTGNAELVALLIDRGADVEARDASWNATPLDWALVGSGQRPREDGDWQATVDTLLDAGASTDEITLDAHDPKAPSPDIVQLLRARGIGPQRGN